MKYLDKLKKERSIDRVIFLAGMVLAFIGFMIPTVYVKQATAAMVDNTVEEEFEEESEELDSIAEEEETNADDEESSDAIDFIDFEELSDDFFDLDDEETDGDEEEEEEVREPVYIIKKDVKNFVLNKNYQPVIDEKTNEPLTTVVTTFEYVDAETLEEEKLTAETTHLNIFGITKSLNVSPYAYNATFFVVIWLCAIAGIVLFFATKIFIGDIVAILVGYGFAIASFISMPATFNVTPLVGYMSVGGYLVIAGWIIATVGSVLSAMHVKAPEIVKEI